MLSMKVMLKAQREVDQMLKLENKLIPETINYDNINQLSKEAQEKLRKLTLLQSDKHQELWVLIHLIFQYY